jgi:2-C-methyl-D-erythritol 2,4-cyclodiphosphate synthase
LVLAGVTFDDARGLIATSDGDVVAHAVTDAILGAAVLGDLGEHFPSNDPTLEGADSMELLGRAVAMVEGAGYAVSHVDVTVIAQSVRVAPRRVEMARSLESSLKCGPGSVSVKATTTDGLGFIGADEGLAAVAVATVSRLNIIR